VRKEREERGTLLPKGTRWAGLLRRFPSPPVAYTVPVLRTVRAGLGVTALLLVAVGFDLFAREPVGGRTGDPLFGGRLVFAVFGRDDGLGDLNVESLLQDRTGFLWVGTDNGLFRYDGSRFVRMGAALAALDTRVSVLHETPGGVLFAGTATGLARREGEEFVAVGEESGLPTSQVPDGQIVSDEAGRVWVGTASGLFIGEKGHFRLVPRPGGNHEVRITALHRDPGGAVWVARGSSLTVGDGTGWRDVEGGIPLPPGEQIDRILTDGSGRLWLRSVRTLWVRDVGTDRFVRDDEGLPASSEFGRLGLDEKDEILVPTVRGLARKSDGAWRVTGRRQGLPGAANAALVDREGSLWVGLAGEGLARRLGQGAFRGGGEEMGLANNLVWAIARGASRSGNGALWVGTEEGLNRFDPEDGSIRTLTRKEGLGGDAVQALAAFPDGRLYAGHWPGGVTLIGPGASAVRRCQFEGVDPSAVKIVSFFRTKGGDLVAGTDRGIFRLPAGGVPDRFVPLKAPRARGPSRQFAFAEDAEGALWGAGEGGLSRLGGPDPRRFGTGDGLRAQDLSGIVRMEDGDFAVGYRNVSGVDRVRVRGGKLTVTPLPEPPGSQPGKAVFLGIDAAGTLWVGTPFGIDVHPRRGEPLHYGRADGLISDDMDQNAFLAEADGTVWIGTSRGLVRFAPGVPAARRLPPPVIILKAWAGGRPLELSTPARLSRRERDVRLTWAALTFLEPRRVKYIYRLVGLDAPPVETGVPEVRYSTLPAGNYRFEVTAVSAAGMPSERPATFAFSVAKPWWGEGWAWILAGLAFGLFVAGVTEWRTRSLEAERHRLEAAVAERSAELATRNRELQEASLTDPLTGLRNRRFFSAEIGREVAKVLRAFRPAGGGPPPEGRDLVFYLVDLDRFKEINDVYGHDVGDTVLVETATRLAEVVRKSDWLIRWGGEEFLIVSGEANRQQARLLAERILSVVSRVPMDLGKGRTTWRTCSVGWAVFPWLPAAPEAVTYEEVLRLADRALLLAKRSGRHQSVGLLPADDGTTGVEEAQAAVRLPALEGDETALSIVRSMGPITPE
jgi:diguanylate cyclase (GGDEF)-like protein